MDTQFDDGTLPDLHDLFFNLLLGLFYDLFDPGRVDTPVGDQPLKGKPGDLPSQRVEGGQNDGLRSVIHDEIDACGGLDRPDITTFPADDLSLDLIAFQVEYGNGVFYGLLRGRPLDALDNDLPGFFIGLLLCVIDDLLL